MERWLDAGNGVRVTGSGMAWIPSEKAIVVADVHLGYDLAAGRRGGWLPRVESGVMVASRILDAAQELRAHRVVVAGDLRHSTRDVDDAERAEVAAFAAALRQHVVLDVALGNHDAGDALIGPGAEHISVGNIDVVHVPPAVLPARMTICGHLHPRVTVRDETGAGGRYPCVLACASVVVLPAFTEWAGGVEASRLVRSLPRAHWRVLPLHGGLIADIGIVHVTDVAGFDQPTGTG